MELLLQKGYPVRGGSPAEATSAKTAKANGIASAGVQGKP
jgi:hypothetical protein